MFAAHLYHTAPQAPVSPPDAIAVAALHLLDLGRYALSGSVPEPTTYS